MRHHRRAKPAARPVGQVLPWEKNFCFNLKGCYSPRLKKPFIPPHLCVGGGRGLTRNFSPFLGGVEGGREILLFGINKTKKEEKILPRVRVLKKAKKDRSWKKRIIFFLWEEKGLFKNFKVDPRQRLPLLVTILNKLRDRALLSQEIQNQSLDAFKSKSRTERPTSAGNWRTSFSNPIPTSFGRRSARDPSSSRSHPGPTLPPALPESR